MTQEALDKIESPKVLVGQQTDKSLARHRPDMAKTPSTHKPCSVRNLLFAFFQHELKPLSRIQNHFSFAALTADPILHSIICVRSEQGAELSKDNFLMQKERMNRWFMMVLWPDLKNGSSPCVASDSTP